VISTFFIPVCCLGYRYSFCSMVQMFYCFILHFVYLLTCTHGISLSLFDFILGDLHIFILLSLMSLLVSASPAFLRFRAGGTCTVRSDSPFFLRCILFIYFDAFLGGVHLPFITFLSHLISSRSRMNNVLHSISLTAFLSSVLRLRCLSPFFLLSFTTFRSCALTFTFSFLFRSLRFVLSFVH